MKNLMLSILQKLLSYFAKRLINKFKPVVIGVTGSVGKSSTKEAIFEVLSGNFKGEVWKSEGNLNNELGLPLTILGFKETPKGLGWFGAIIKAKWFSFFTKEYPRYLVLEFAADKPGDMQYLTSIAKPKIAVITYVGEAHLEYFEDIDKIALEKSILVKSLSQDGWAVLNSDNEYVWRIGLASRGKVIYYGIGNKAAIQAKNIKIDINGTNFELNYQKIKKNVNLKVVGKHQVYSVLAAISVGLALNIKIEKIISAVQNIHSLPGRDLIIKGINGCSIIDSSYNANLTSMKALLDTLKSLKSKRKKIAVLGDMREMGQISKSAHEEIGKMANLIADKVVAIGPMSKNMNADEWFSDSKKAAQYLVNNIGENDIILVKGSHAMEMEKIVRVLTNRD